MNNDRAARAIYRCKIHGDFVVTLEDGQYIRLQPCTVFVGMNEDKTQIMQCGEMCEMTSLKNLLDKKEPTIRGLDDDIAQELIETVRELKKDAGEQTRFVTQQNIDKTKTRMELEKRLKDARAEMQAAMDSPFDI